MSTLLYFMRSAWINGKIYIEKNASEQRKENITR
jgi:hypothetical protein